jgi:hypothetical protein
MRRPVLSALVLAVSAAAAIGCGRKATEADCQLIVDRNVELQMKALNINDPVVIAKKQDELRGEMKGELQQCVGRRVTDGIMDCVKVAKSTAEISECMR